MDAPVAVAGGCDLGCDDADPCTTDGCDAFSLCTHAPVIEGASGAICSLRSAVETGDACADGRERERARRLVGRLDPRRFDDAPPWMMRAELHTVRRLKSKVRVLATRGALSRPCSRAVLDGLRTVGGTIRAGLRPSRLPQFLRAGIGLPRSRDTLMYSPARVKDLPAGARAAPGEVAAKAECPRRALPAKVAG